MFFSGFAVAEEIQGPQSLDVEAVKNLAKVEKLKLISFSEKSRVISFRKSDGNVRINVYWTTGTVGTCLDHPRQGKTQLFRRNVDLSTLREIFRNPRLHTGSGYHTINQLNDQDNFLVGDRAHVRGFADCTIASGRQTSGNYKGKVKIRYDDGQIYHVDYDQLEEISQIYDDNQCLNLEKEAKTQLERIDDELEKMKNERARVKEILDEIEEGKRKAEAEAEAERMRKRIAEVAAEMAAEAERKRKREAQNEAIIEQVFKKMREENIQKQAFLDSQRNARGKYIHYNLTQGYHVNEYFDETVTSMACGGNATIFLYEDGSWAWTSGLTKQLHNKLNGRQITLPPPTYVALGSQDRYYVKFEDGKAQWVGCENMSDLLYNTNKIVKTVAFGEDWDTYFVVFTDGWWQCGGTIPYSLSDLLRRRNNKPDLECVSLGPGGEYYLKAKNGRTWWGGMSTENLNIASKHHDSIQFMDFGDNDTFFLRYT